ncbi:hypothetical protein [Pseudonocardia humida]|uniref:Uncharacterized protein n=1 Tax=Pseudonocardia humida TaxID=2800819 RepID=A0ABT1A5B0_9PSEU|nr:hypothetical protein [Pseudonocardia humida]MCO1658185.1 hypothetical protein [Pseudonocardia humida]
MDPTTCSVCVLAGSMGGAVAGLCAARRRARWHARGRERGRTGRTWPGGRARPRPPGEGGDADV